MKSLSLMSMLIKHVCNHKFVVYYVIFDTTSVREIFICTIVNSKKLYEILVLGFNKTFNLAAIASPSK